MARRIWKLFLGCWRRCTIESLGPCVAYWHSVSSNIELRSRLFQIVEPLPGCLCERVSRCTSSSSTTNPVLGALSRLNLCFGFAGAGMEKFINKSSKHAKPSSGRGRVQCTSSCERDTLNRMRRSELTIYSTGPLFGGRASRLGMKSSPPSSTCIN